MYFYLEEEERGTITRSIILLLLWKFMKDYAPSR